MKEYPLGSFAHSPWAKKQKTKIIRNCERCGKVFIGDMYFKPICKTCRNKKVGGLK